MLYSFVGPLNSLYNVPLLVVSFNTKSISYERFVPCGKFGSPYLGKAQQPQEQRYPFLPVCAVFSRVQTMVYGCQCLAFNVRTDVDAYDCTQGMYEHRESSLHWQLTLGEKDYAAPGTPTLVGIVFQWDAVPTELSRPLVCHQYKVQNVLPSTKSKMCL